MVRRGRQVTAKAEVLLVEDDLLVLRAARKALSLGGIACDEAQDATSAMTRLEQGRYKLVLSDLMLPKVSGLELLEHTQTLDRPPQFVMITGYATLDNALACFRSGAFDFLPKPFDVAELLGVVQRALDYGDRIRGVPIESVSTGRDMAERYFLGRHCWTQLDPEGTATVGVGETFPDILHELVSAELPEPEEHVLQGQCLCSLHTQDDLVYRVWSPLTGRILINNQRLATDLGIISSDPFTKGWLTRILPTDRERELAQLVRRRPAARSRT